MDNSPHPYHQSLCQSSSLDSQPSMFVHPNRALNLNHFHDAGQDNSDDPGKEPMFEKPLTPSDVGKLNRLVIPKQHAEKYFPLSGDSSDKGLLLSFEDESGKCWRFRYSYWNSSQSYVLTKGWSRYVKEKQLDAGDVILFHRHRTDGDRLFVGWRKRAAANVGMVAGDGAGGNKVIGWNRGYQNPYLGQVQAHGANAPCQPTDCLHAGAIGEHQTAQANPRRLLRLFGVNMECQPHESQPSTTLDASSFSPHHFYSSNFMDMALSGGTNHMRNHRG